MLLLLVCLVLCTGCTVPKGVIDTQMDTYDDIYHKELYEEKVDRP